MEAPALFITTTRVRCAYFQLRRGDCVDVHLPKGRAVYTIIRVIRTQRNGLIGLVRIGNTMHTKKHLFSNKHLYYVERELLPQESVGRDLMVGDVVVHRRSSHYDHPMKIITLDNHEETAGIRSARFRQNGHEFTSWVYQDDVYTVKADEPAVQGLI